MIITISGTPGTGKTFIAKKISKLTKNGMEYFDLNRYIKQNRLYEKYDKKAKTYDVDVEQLKTIINPTLNKSMSKNKKMDLLIGKNLDINQLFKKIPKNIEGIIIDSHLSHYLESNYCIIIRTDIKKLYKRLQKRKYTKAKIKDNIESEIFEVCLDEARKLKRHIITVNN